MRSSNGFINIEMDAGADFFERNGNLAFNRFQGNIENFCNIAVFEFFFFDQFKDQLAFGGQWLQWRLYTGHHFCRNHQLFRIKIDAFEFHIGFFHTISEVFILPAEVIEEYF